MQIEVIIILSQLHTSVSGFNIFFLFKFFSFEDAVIYGFIYEHLPRFTFNSVVFVSLFF